MTSNHKIIIRSVLCCLAVFSGFFFLSACDSRSESDAYDYPVKPGTDEWKTLGGLPQMIEVCQIPEDILKDISTKGLVETVLNYPLLINMMAFNFPQDGFDSVYSYFNGLRELFSRNDAGVEVMSRYIIMDPAAIKDDWTDLEKGRYSLNFYRIEIILAQKALLEKLTSAQRIELLKETLAKYESRLENPEVYGVISEMSSTWLIGRILQQESAPSYTLSEPDYGKYLFYLEHGGLAESWIHEKILEQAEKYLLDK